MAQSQWTLAVYKNIKEATIEALRSRISEILKLTIKEAKAKLKILTEEDI